MSAICANSFIDQLGFGPPKPIHNLPGAVFRFQAHQFLYLSSNMAEVSDT